VEACTRNSAASRQAKNNLNQEFANQAEPRTSPVPVAMRAIAFAVLIPGKIRQRRGLVRSVGRAISELLPSASGSPLWDRVWIGIGRICGL
jgi:hypothetical protein